MERLSNRLLLKYKLVKKQSTCDEHIDKQNEEKNEMEKLARDFNQEPKKEANGSGDESDEFGVFDPAKHVSFDEKVRFAE